MKETDFKIKMNELKEKKKNILDSIFISSKQANSILNYQHKLKEADLLIRYTELSIKVDNIVKMLGDILRKNDPSGDSNMLRSIFVEFYSKLDEFESKEELEKVHTILSKQHKPPTKQEAKK